MSLRDVVRAVQADFLESGCPAPVLFGSRWLADHAEPSRVVVIPSPASNRDSYVPPQQIMARGAQPQTLEQVQQQGGSNPRPVMCRIVGCEIHIWAGAPIGSEHLQEDADQDALDALVNQTVLSFYRVAWGNNAVLKGHQLESPKHVRRGLVYLLTGTVEVPIVDIQFPLGAITECARTWDLTTATGLIRAELIAPTLLPTGLPIQVATFLTGVPTGPQL